MVPDTVNPELPHAELDVAAVGVGATILPQVAPLDPEEVVDDTGVAARRLVRPVDFFSPFRAE